MKPTRMKLLRFVFAVLCAALLAAPLPRGLACTCWSVAGDRAAGGGTLIAKNRDYVPGPSRVRVEVPRKGFRFIGLFPEKKKIGVVAGTNERGLTVVTMTAGTVPRNLRFEHGRGLNREILEGYASVDEVLRNREMFSEGRPAFYLLSDGKKTAVVEVAPGGKFAVESTEEGSLSHTNHFLDSTLAGANRVEPGESSLARLKRIRELLDAHSGPFAREDFIAFSQDREGAPDDRIWRTGPKSRTLATWIVANPRKGPPSVFVRMANPGEAEACWSMTLDKAFWKAGVVREGTCPEVETRAAP